MMYFRIKKLRRITVFLLFCIISVGAESEETSGQESLSVDDLMDDATQALNQQQYTRAIDMYTRLIELPDNESKRNAMELLGLAKEKEGNITEALKIYQLYLQQYRKGDGVERVKQRIAGILTAEIRTDVPEKKVKRKSSWRSNTYLSQNARQDTSISDGVDEPNISASMTSHMSTNGRGKISTYKIKTRLSASRQDDLDDASKAKVRLSYLFVDLSDKKSGFFSSLGRQSSRGGGVLGRFDGINIGKRFGKKNSINFATGMLASPYVISLDDTRTFNSLNLDTGPWYGYWAGSAYIVDQQSEGMTDRRAVGGLVRYGHPERNLFTLVDFDIFYNMLNILSNQFSITHNKVTTYSMLLDYRKSPPVSTRNALFNQPVHTLKELNHLYPNVDDIYGLARDRTSAYYIALFGASHQINDNFRVEGDMSKTNVPATLASGGVRATPGTDEYSFSSQIVAKDIYQKGDVSVASLRYSDTMFSTAVSVLGNTLIPLGDTWNLRPSVTYSYSEFKESSDYSVSKGFSIRIDSRQIKSFSFEFEFGVDFGTFYSPENGNFESTSKFLSAGYSLSF